ncbi:unnamed protein product [Blepharisma stoltei]|uniref:DUF4378 domain-containing protein n=1 Tax=Blepharisma stoltei TaxID=1481888 RepID=A0AAU9J6P1_9CILI|nr:unnamed protein product [Blepharisma stoltei]
MNIAMIKPLLPRSRRPLPHPEDWNDRFTLAKIPNYDTSSGTHISSLNQSKSNVKNIRVSSLKPQSSSGSTKSRNLTRSSSRSSRRRPQELTDNQVEILKDELRNTWRTFQIPEQHQTLYENRVFTLSKPKIAALVAREIDSIEKSTSNICEILNLIRDREYLLSKLKEEADMVEKITDKVELEMAKYECADYLKKLREVTLNTVENICIWREFFKDLTLDFQWESKGYLEKMQTDTLFLKETVLSKYFKFKSKSDPLLLSLADKSSGSIIQIMNLSKKKKQKMPIPISYHSYTRYKKAEEVIKAIGTGKEEKSKGNKKENGLRPAKLIENEDETQDPFEDKSMTKENVILLDENEIKQISEELASELINTEAWDSAPGIVNESLHDMINASLMLYSNIILDKVVTTVLMQMIPEVSREAYREINDSEYIDIWNGIILYVVDQSVLEICSDEALAILSENITESIISSIKLDSYVIEALSEENSQNKDIVQDIHKDLINDFVTLEWIEELAEEELVQYKIDEVRKELPVHLQREIFVRDKDIIYNRLAEIVYFGILNDFVGNLWTPGIIISAVEEEKGNQEIDINEIFVLRDPSVVIEEVKKSQTNKINSVYQR